MAKKKKIISPPHKSPEISEKFKISFCFLKQKYKSGIKKIIKMKKLGVLVKRFFEMKFKKVIKVLPAVYRATKSTGYFKRSTLNTA